MIFLGILVALFWLPLILKIIDGAWLEPMIDLGIMEFEYANIPVGLTIMYLVFLPIYYFYIKPYDEALDKLIQEQRKKAIDEAYGKQKNRLKSLWD